MDNEYISYNELFTTSDFYLASVLLARGFELVSVDKTNLRRNQFCFYDSENLQEIVWQFQMKNIAVDSHTVFAAQKRLKNLIYN